MLKKTMLYALCLAGLTGCGTFQKMSPAPVPLAKDGKPVAEIIIPANAHPAVDFAAKELQHWVKEISGAELPIVNAPAGASASIELTVKPAGYEDDLAKMKGTDGYAVRTKGGKITIIGDRPKGVLNGVFRMLFRNTDIIWARPNLEFGTSFSKNPNLTLTQTNYIDVPAYVLRGWQMGSGRIIPTEEWQVRNACNWSAGSTGFQEKRIKYDPVLEYGGGHNLVGNFIPEKKYYKTHPEFYPLKDGKRMRPSEYRESTQLCFTNKELVKIFNKEVDDRIKANPNYDTYRIMIEDNYNLCECDECMKPIKLADGSLLNNDHTAFRSTQFFMWLNQIAKHIKTNYPAKRILTFGYFFTEIPPKCSVEDNISISFCPIYKNSKYDITAPENKLTMNKFQGWMKVTNQLTWREYYGLCHAFPRPMDVVALADWKYVNSFGVNRTYSEMYADHKTASRDDTITWDVNSMYFWVLANSPWDPSQNVYEMRNTFLTRVYGAAADDVREFYSIIEKSWFAVGGDSKWNDRARGNWLACVVKPGLVETCRNALERAAAKVDKPNGKKMLAALRTAFENNTRDLKPQLLTATKTAAKPDFDLDFTSGDWAKAAPSTNFILQEGMVPQDKTSVKVLHDHKNIYIGAICQNRNINKFHPKPSGQPRDKWFNGEKFEIFLTGPGPDGKTASYQFVITCTGNIYDSLNKDAKWNGVFDSQIKNTKDGWRLMVTIPFTTLGYKSAPDKCTAMFLRYISADDSQTAVAYWNGGAPHSTSSYVDMKLEK